jgi:hypothetical protein
MTNSVLLHNVEHKDLHIITERGAQYGDEVMSAITFPAEFRNLQADYPIVFRKASDDVHFEAIALFGFQEGENLFLSPKGWDAYSLPMSLDRLPFMIGRAGEELMVHIDLDSPRVSKSQGKPVFLPHGGNSEYLEHINSTLFALHQGMMSMPPFINTLIELKLLEGFTLDVELNDGSQNRLAGFYTINEEHLNALDGATLKRLQDAGHLQAIYYALASLSNFRQLIERKNLRNAGNR